MELWKAAQCSAERQRERGWGRGCGAALVDRHTQTHTTDGAPGCYGDRPIAREREITADWVDDARRLLL